MFDDVQISQFWSKVDKSAGPDACWPWLGAKTAGGYGTFRIARRQIAAHRFSLILATGRFDMFPPAELHYRAANQACHECANKPCVNPTHLRWDTAEGNRADFVNSPGFRESIEKGLATKARTGNWGGGPARQDYTELTRKVIEEFNSPFSAAHSYQKKAVKSVFDPRCERFGGVK